MKREGHQKCFFKIPKKSVVPYNAKSYTKYQLFFACENFSRGSQEPDVANISHCNLVLV